MRRIEASGCPTVCLPLHIKARPASPPRVRGHSSRLCGVSVFPARHLERLQTQHLGPAHYSALSPALFAEPTHLECKLRTLFSRALFLVLAAQLARDSVSAPKLLLSFLLIGRGEAKIAAVLYCSPRGVAQRQFRRVWVGIRWSSVT